MSPTFSCKPCPLLSRAGSAGLTHPSQEWEGRKAGDPRILPVLGDQSLEGEEGAQPGYPGRIQPSDSWRRCSPRGWKRISRVVPQRGVHLPGSPEGAPPSLASQEGDLLQDPPGWVSLDWESRTESGGTVEGLLLPAPWREPAWEAPSSTRDPAPEGASLPGTPQTCRTFLGVPVDPPAWAPR